MAPGGRSTGCKTCRMRHLKCDEARPHCQRCEKAGLECRGYDVINVFVDERSRILERESKPRSERRRAAEVRPSNRARSSPRPAKDDAACLDAKPPGPTTLYTLDLRDQTHPLHKTLSPLSTSLPDKGEDMYLSFMRRKLLTRLPGFKFYFKSIMNPSPSGFKAGWLTPVLSQGPLKAPLEPAVSALSRAWFGKMQAQPSVTAQGMVQYGKALSELKLALSSGCWRNRDVVISSMCLILYEAVAFTDHNAWLNHAKGLGELIEAQGPEKFQDSIGIGIMRAVKYPVIMSAMARDVPTFFGQEKWQRVPWQVHPSLKDDNDYLFDIFGNTPGLVRAVRQCERERSIDSIPIVKEITTGIGKLCEWRWSYELLHPGFAWIDDLQSTESSTLFPYDLQFGSLFDNHVIGLYSGLMIYHIWLLARLNGESSYEHLLPPFPQGLVKTNPLLLPGVDKLNLVSLAREICHMIRFRMRCLRGDNSIAFGLFFPTRMAWLVFKNFPEERNWIESTAHEFENESGIQFSRLAFWEGKQDSPELKSQCT